MSTETTTPKLDVRKAMAGTKAQQVLEAMAKIESQKAEAIQELLAERAKIDEQLAQLGHSDGTKASAPRKRTGAQKPAAERHCDICDANGHDARAHRSQDPKRKFTQKELTEKGLA